jgi:very-short-patch-repair endonuclease
MQSGQWGVITLEQALGAGLSHSAVKRHVAAGRWRRLLPGVYAVEESPAFEQEALAACLWAGGDAVISHRAAGRLHGLAGMERAGPEITVPPGTNPRSARVIAHQLKVERTERVQIRGVPVTDVERTLVDLGAVLGHLDLAIAVEDAWCRGLVHPDGLWSRLGFHTTRGRPGGRSLRRVLADCFKRRRPMESPLEVKLWWLLRRYGIDPPEVQYDFHDDAGQPLRLDFAYERQRMAIEVDGFETHRERFERDRERASRLAAAGWRWIPVTYEALKRPHKVLDWIRRGLASGPTAPPWELAAGAW